MKTPHITIRTCALCAIIALAAMLSGCSTTESKAADNKWIAERAAVLTGKTNPDTGKEYTPEQALDAAKLENYYATKTAGSVMTDAVVNIVAPARGSEAPYSVMNSHPPASMAVSPSVQPSMGSMGHCFVAGTPVRTPAGAREIQDIRAGDSVLSFNERSGKVEPARVSKVIVSKRSDLMVLTSPHGSVTCSQNHRFLTVESRWTMASALSASDKVLALGTDFVGVVPMKCTAKHQDVPTPITVHNFEVEGNHDYFVGPDAILCHNTK